MDDVSDEEEFHLVEQKNYEKIQIKLTKVGYADGVNDGRDAVFQKSFDKGYSDGLITGLELEKIKAFYTNIKQLPAKDRFFAEKVNFEELNIEETKSRAHYQYLKNPLLGLNTISEKQIAYVESVRNLLKQKCPNTTSLWAKDY